MLTKDQRLPEQYHRGNKYQNFRNSLGNMSNSKFLLVRLKLPIHTGEVENPNLFTGDWFCRPHFHPGTFRGGFSLGIEAGCFYTGNVILFQIKVNARNVNPIQDGLFRGCSRMGGDLFGTVIPYLRKIQKMYKSRDASLEFCWHLHFSNRNQQILLHQEIHI